MKKHKLGPFIHQVRGISFKPNEISEIPLNNFKPILKANNITEDGIDDENLIYIRQERINEIQFIKKGDLLLAASSGSKKVIGKNIFFKDDFDGSFGAFCKVVRPLDGIYPEYLKHFFRTPYYRNNISTVVQGANINNLKNRDLDNLKVSIPEKFEDQIRIAKVLTKAEELIAKRKESINLLDELIKSTFLEMFGDPVRNEKVWKTDRLSNYSIVKIGPFGSLLHKRDYVRNGIPLVNPTHINNGKIIIDSGFTISEEKLNQLKSYRLIEGDIVLARRGEIGRCGIVTKNENGYICGTGSMFIRPSKSLISIYLLNLIMTEQMVQKMEDFSKGVTMKNINSKSVSAMQIILPPIELQLKFAKIAKEIDSLKSKYQTSLDELENLYGSLSQKAFKGELDLSGVEVDTVEEC
jgi:type I restriction enzyme S subunit